MITSGILHDKEASEQERIELLWSRTWLYHPIPAKSFFVVKLRSSAAAVARLVFSLFLTSPSSIVIAP